MALRKVGQLLDKMNRIYSSLDAAENALPSIDRDMMLNHVRELYDAILDTGIARVYPALEAEAAVKSQEHTPLLHTAPMTIVELPVAPAQEEEPLHVAPAKIELAPVVEPVAVTPPVAESKEEFTAPPAPKVEFEVEPIRQQEPVLVPPPVVLETPAVVVEAPVSQPIKEPVAQPVVMHFTADREKAAAEFNPEYDELFAYNAPTEIAHKLSEKKIENLKLAMGLGERFLFIQKLFGGNVSEFERAIEALNSMKSLDDARTYLEANCTGRFAWLNGEENITLAKNFIRLVRRRTLPSA